jgi:hypothetical protein
MTGAPTMIASTMIQAAIQIGALLAVAILRPVMVASVTLVSPVVMLVVR